MNTATAPYHHFEAAAGIARSALASSRLIQLDSAVTPGRISPDS
jgi:hypothetical protein